jgi:TolA-binding protein
MWVIVFLLASLTGGSASGQAERHKAELTVTRRERERFDFANGLFARNMYEMAVEAYRDFLDEFPASRLSETARYRMAEAYYAADRYQEALNVYTAFLSEYPSSDLTDQALLGIGQCYYFLGDLKNSEKTLEKLLAQERAGKTAAGAKYYLASVYEKREDLERARELLTDMLGERPPGEYAAFAHMKLGDVRRAGGDLSGAAESYLESASAADEKRLAGEALLRAAEVYFDMKEFSKATDLCERVLAGAVSPGIRNAAADVLFSSLYRAGKYGIIIERYRSFLDTTDDPRVSSKIIFVAGEAHLRENRTDEALDLFRRVINGYPQSVLAGKALVREAWILFGRERYGAARKSLAALESRTGDLPPEAALIRARVFHATGEEHEAVELLEKISDENPGTKPAREALFLLTEIRAANGEAESSARGQKEFVRLYPKDPRAPVLLMKAAKTALRKGEDEEALGLYGDFLERYPGSEYVPDAMFGQGRALQGRGEYADAAAKYTALLERVREPRREQRVLYQLGRTFQKRELWDQAIEVYGKAVSMGQAGGETEVHAALLEALAYCYYQKGERRAAANTYLRIMSEYPDTAVSESAYLWTADLFLEEKEPDTVLFILKRLSGALPDIGQDGRVLVLYGKAFLEKRKWDEAEAYFREAVEKEVDHPYREHAYIGLGRLMARKGSHDEAIRNFDLALASHRDNYSGALARMGKAEVYYDLMDFVRAAKNYMMVAILYEDSELSPEALYKAGKAFGKAGDKGSRDEAWDELLRRFPESRYAVEAGEKDRNG